MSKLSQKAIWRPFSRTPLIHIFIFPLEECPIENSRHYLISLCIIWPMDGGSFDFVPIIALSIFCWYTSLLDSTWRTALVSPSPYMFKITRYLASCLCRLTKVILEYAQFQWVQTYIITEIRCTYRRDERKLLTASTQTLMKNRYAYYWHIKTLSWSPPLKLIS